jgi:glycosyltransferase involved in cell wall biosynthesis
MKVEEVMLMNKSDTISIYVRNQKITPSSYYRVIQYSRYFEGNLQIREIAPLGIYKKQLNVDKTDTISKYLIGLVYYLTMVLRCIYYLTCDCIKKPKYVIVSKTFCPRYTPIIARVLITILAKNTSLYWDFDDYIFKSGEISKSQAKILEKYSKKIIVTNEFLKSKINKEFQDKVYLLPTTDGDLQGFNPQTLLENRLELLKKEIRMVWVATSNNIPHLAKVISALDQAAKIIKDVQCKKLVLTVVCNKTFKAEVENLVIRNINWTREIAKKEIYDSHIGIMPLLMTEYSQGKGAFKLVQYISTGLPVVASKVGFNQEVVSETTGFLVDDELIIEGWVSAIQDLSSSNEAWTNFSENAYLSWKANFSFEQNLLFWRNLLLEKVESTNSNIT